MCVCVCACVCVSKRAYSPWNRVLLEKLTGFQLVKKFSAFYGTPKFITAFTSAHIYIYIYIYILHDGLAEEKHVRGYCK